MTIFCCFLPFLTQKWLRGQDLAPNIGVLTLFWVIFYALDRGLYLTRILPWILVSTAESDAGKPDENIPHKSAVGDEFLVWSQLFLGYIAFPSFRRPLSDLLGSRVGTVGIFGFWPKNCPFLASMKSQKWLYLVCFLTVFCCFFHCIAHTNICEAY